MGSYCSIKSQRQLSGKCSEHYPNFCSWPPAAVQLATINVCNRCIAVVRKFEHKNDKGFHRAKQLLLLDFLYIYFA